MGHNSKNAKNKVPLDVHVDSLLREASGVMEETANLKWEWEHYCRLETLVSKIREREAQRDNLNRNSSSSTTTTTTSTTDGSGDKAEEETEKESSLDAQQVERQRQFGPFMEWLREQGVNTDKVEIVFKDTLQGFGLKTKVPMKTGEVVFTIPQKAIITSNVAKESKLKLMAEKDPLLTGMQNVLLAMFLIYERYVNPFSIWKKYIDTIPQTFDTVVYFTKDEMTLMKNSPHAFREALRMLRNVTRQYAYFQTKFRVSKDKDKYHIMHAHYIVSIEQKATDSASKVLKPIFTYNRYIWGVSAVTTRINHLPNPNGEPMLSLIPLWDLANHEESEAISTDFSDQTQTLICYAGHDYEKNTDFTIFYGKRTSIDFLVHNGFVPQNFRNDYYCLELGIGINDVNHNRKRAILRKFGLESHNSFAVHPESLETATKLFAFLRIFLSDDGTLSEIEEKGDNLAFLLEPSEAIWKFLATRFAILKKATENSLASNLKSLYGDTRASELPRAALVLLQLLKNEQKTLEMLTHASESHVKLPN